MERRSINPRPNWREKVEQLGLIYHSTDNEPYWDESAYYYFTEAQVNELEHATELLHDLCEKAVDYIIKNKRYDGFDFSPLAISLIEESYKNKNPSLYGRFDLAYDGVNPPKMLEYNADTPTSLYEASVVQWEWLQSLKLGADQFNSIHEKLISAWNELIPQDELVHLSGFLDDEEDYGTISYLADTALQVTKKIKVIPLQEIALSEKFVRSYFVDNEGIKIRYLFKLHPWEWMIKDEFAPYLLKSGLTIFEPAWRMIIQNKNILVVLWELFPNCSYLLPAYSRPAEFSKSFVSKPKWGREGDNVTFHQSKMSFALPENTEEKNFIYQEWFNVPTFNGNYPTIGSWVINGQSAGIGVREDKTSVVKRTGRFVPHCFL